MFKKLLSLLFICAAGSIAAAQTFNQPESVVYDEFAKRYFISNMGDNEVLQIDSLGTTTVFAEGLFEPKGVFIVDDTLLVVVNTNYVDGYSLSTGVRNFRWELEAAGLMNDGTVDDEGNLYITDTFLGRIYKLDLKTGEYITLSSSISSPNGILYDSVSKALLVCTWGTNASIYSYSLTNSTLSRLAATSFPDLDGLAMDNCGNIYFSSWTRNSVYVFDAEFKNPPTRIASGYSGAADISINENQVLAIPAMSLNTINYVDLHWECQKEIELLLPLNDSQISGSVVNMDWEGQEFPDSYELEYATDSNFYASVNRFQTLGSDTILHDLLTGETYYWRVRHIGGNTKNLFGEVYSFRTKHAQTSGIASTKGNFEFAPYPNPTSVKLSIHRNTKRVQFYDLAGRLVYDVEPVENTVDISQLQIGVYMAVVTLHDTSQATYRVVKRDSY